MKKYSVRIVYEGQGIGRVEVAAEDRLEAEDYVLGNIEVDVDEEIINH